VYCLRARISHAATATARASYFTRLRARSAKHVRMGHVIVMLSVERRAVARGHKSAWLLLVAGSESNLARLSCCLVCQYRNPLARLRILQPSPIVNLSFDLASRPYIQDKIVVNVLRSRSIWKCSRIVFASLMSSYSCATVCSCAVMNDRGHDGISRGTHEPSNHPHG
jgi:hypothetical protein